MNFKVWHLIIKGYDQEDFSVSIIIFALSSWGGNLDFDTTIRLKKINIHDNKINIVIKHHLRIDIF